MSDLPEGIRNAKPEINSNTVGDNSNHSLLDGNPSDTFRILKNINQSAQEGSMPGETTAPRIVDSKIPPRAQAGNTGESSGTASDATVPSKNSMLDRYINQARGPEADIRRSVVAGIKWMDANPHATPIFDGPESYPANAPAKALEKAMMDAFGDHSGSSFIHSLKQVQHYKEFGYDSFLQRVNLKPGGAIRGRASAIVGALGLLPFGLSAVPQANEFKRFQ